jgi:hypothetical protein
VTRLALDGVPDREMAGARYRDDDDNSTRRGEVRGVRVTSLHVYTFNWNEAPLVPFFLRHWSQVAEKVVVLDHHSDDGSAEALATAGCTVLPYGTPGKYVIGEQDGERQTCWHEVRGEARAPAAPPTWVAVVDFDEFLWHPDGLGAFLQRATAEGHSVLRPAGFEMMSETFPLDDGRPLTAQIRRGFRHGQYCKPILFRPDHVASMRFASGAHGASPVDADGQRVSITNVSDLKLLHYRRLSFDHYLSRSRAQLARLDPDELAVGRGFHLAESEEHLRKVWAELDSQAVEVL